MKFRIRALALAVGLLWGVGIFTIGVANLASPGYGSAFLQLLASVYPGYSATATFGQVIIATLYGWWTAPSAARSSPGSITGSQRSSAPQPD